MKLKNKNIIFCIIFLLLFGYNTAEGGLRETSVDIEEVSTYMINEQSGMGVGEELSEDIFEIEPETKEYVIGTKDVLKVTVWGHEDLNVKTTVGLDGTISMPLLGEVFVNGLTVKEVKKMLTKLLEKDYIVDAVVDIAIDEYNSKSVFIFGDVQKPGEYKLKGYTTVLDIFPMSGGTVGGLDKTMLITRKKTVSEFGSGISGDGVEKIGVKVVDLKRLLVHGDLSQNYHIEAGDIIYIYSPDSKGYGEHIYVLGAVKNPGIFTYRSGLSVLDAIIMAGGFNELASPNSTMVVRGDGIGRETIRVRMSKVMKNGDLSENILLKPDDFIIIHEGWL